MNLPGIIIFCFMFCCTVWAKAAAFTVYCNGLAVPVKEQNDVAPEYGLSAYKYMELTYGGQALNVEVETDFSFGDADWSISPGSYGITGVREGRKVSFVIDRTGYVVLFF